MCWTRKELIRLAASGMVDGCRVNKEMAETLGPVVDTSLLPGERVAVRTRRMLSRKGRGVVRIRVFGDASWVGLILLVCGGAV